MRAGPRLSRRTCASLASALVLGTLWPSPAPAQSCTVSTEPVLFDPYDPLGGAPADGVGAVRLRCDDAVAATIALGTATGGSGRALRGADDELRYELYSDPARMLPWGDGGAAPVRAASGPEAELTVYGRIAPGQNVRDGSYTDSVTIILTF
jgi:spore coat protein U-like protein